jgi:hypothetical protein
LATLVKAVFNAWPDEAYMILDDSAK